MSKPTIKPRNLPKLTLKQQLPRPHPLHNTTRTQSFTTTLPNPGTQGTKLHAWTVGGTHVSRISPRHLNPSISSRLKHLEQKQSPLGRHLYSLLDYRYQEAVSRYPHLRHAEEVERALRAYEELRTETSMQEGNRGSMVQRGKWLTVSFEMMEAVKFKQAKEAEVGSYGLEEIRKWIEDGEGAEVRLWGLWREFLEDGARAAERRRRLRREEEARRFEELRERVRVPWMGTVSLSLLAGAVAWVFGGRKEEEEGPSE